MNSLPFITRFPELAESRQRLFEESTVAIHEVDAEGIIRSVNQAECTLLGYQPHELIDHYAWEFVVAEHQEASRQGICRKLAREQPVGVITRELRRADGTCLWVEIHETLLANAAGEVVGIRSGLVDVTERHKFEAEIGREHDRMKFLMRSWTRAIVTADALGRIDYLNPAAESLLGWQREEAMGRPLQMVCRVLEATGARLDLMSCMLGDSSICGPAAKYLLLDRAGESHSISLAASPVTDDKAVVVGVAVVFEAC